MSRNSSTPEYNLVVWGLQEVLTVQGHFVTLFRTLKDYVPVRSDMGPAFREGFRERWESEKAKALASEVVSKRIIWQALTQMQKDPERPWESLNSAQVTKLNSLREFHDLALLESLWTVVAETHKLLELIMPFVTGTEKKLLRLEHDSIRGFQTLYHEKFLETTGREPSRIILHGERETVPVKTVCDNFVPLVFNLARILELGSTDCLTGFFDFGTDSTDAEEYSAPVIDAEKRQAAIDSFDFTRGKNADLLSYFMALIAKSPMEPFFPLREGKIDEVLSRLHENLSTDRGKPLMLGFRSQASLMSNFFATKLTRGAILDITKREFPESELVAHWVEEKLAQVDLEDSVVSDFRVRIGKVPVSPGEETRF